MKEKTVLPGGEKRVIMVAKIKKILFSISFTGVLLLLFAIAVGLATFVERDYGTETSRALIYNSLSLEILIVLLVVNLIGSIVRYRMYRRAKWGVFVFHLSFIFIFLGAGITRYISFEGSMHIREGESSAEMNSMNSYLRFEAESGGEKKLIEKQIFVCPASVKHINPSFTINNKEVEIKFINYFAGGSTKIESSDTGIPALTLVTSGVHSGRKESSLMQYDTLRVDKVKFSFQNQKPADIQFLIRDDALYIFPADTLKRIDMQTQAMSFLPGDSIHKLELMQLYSFHDLSFVVKSYLPKAQKIMTSKPNVKAGETRDVIEYEVRVDDVSRKIFLYGGKGMFVKPQELEVNKVKFKFGFGGKMLHLPFSIALTRFNMDRYPGSNSPASYESFVRLIDRERDVDMDYHIYMNHILNYRGYRFFQSSYDQDEKGTILSVNHDSWGTLFTYLGYFLMTLGMIISLFHKKGRFRILANQFAKVRASVFVFFFLLSAVRLSANDTIPVSPVPQHLAASFSTILVQSHDGRIKPMHTFANELVRKITGTSSYGEQKPEQIILGMMTYPSQWQKVPMIKITHEAYHGLQKFLDTEKKYVSFEDLIDPVAGYKLSKVVQEAYSKAPQRRNKFDKEVLKVDEVVNIAYMIYQGDLFRIFPVRDDANHTWIESKKADQYLNGEEALFVKGILSMYLTEIKKGDQEKADYYLQFIRDYQKKNSGDIYLSENRIKAEIMYNELNINYKLMIWYAILGFILLVIQFLALLIPKINIRLINQIAFYLLFLLFLGHSLGMGVRWYISGHAPWSDSYESMIYIAWASILAGLLFGRKSAFALSATAILSASLMSVAMMTWVNPEITNLVPVLKSYWLVLHVAVIISSYGFLGLGAFLGLFNLLIINFKTDKNHLRLDKTVGELTIIIEMTLTLGLYLLSIGVFLGAIWANESWGRYWGWDSKETWSFVSMLIYGFVIHMRFIPGLKSKVVFNIASFFAFATILMTYFGVNFILTGLHSYASGDGFTVPPITYYAISVFVILAIMAVVVERKYRGTLEKS
jgi:cytochrome c-type biogenesis protein CcsB